MKMVIGDIGKNAGEVVRVSLSEFDGHDLVDVRVFFKTQTSPELKPTKKGVALRPALLPELIALLKDAEYQARAAGLIGDDGKAATA